MPITSISRDTPNNVSIVRITCTDTLAQIAVANYILNQTPIINMLNKGIWQWFNGDTLLFDSADGNAFFQFTDDTFTSLVLMASSTDGTVSPGLINQVGIYAASGTVISGTYSLPSQVQVPVGSLGNGLNANSARFWRGDGVWGLVSDTTFHSIFSVYVAPDGSDLTGDGSINSPYQTISHALSAITINSSLQIFTIVLTGGVYNEVAQIALKPWVNLVSYTQGTTINNSVDIILDPEWDTTTNGFIYIENLSITNNLDLDFNTVPNSSSPVCNLNDINVNGLLNLNGNATNLVTFYLNSCFIQSAQFNNAAIVTFNNYYFSLVNAGNTTIVAPTYLFSTSDYYNAGLDLVGDTAGPIMQNYNIRNSSVSIPLTVSNVNATLNIDATSYVSPTVLTGATVNLLTIANGVDAIYSPVNYVPDASGGTNPVNSVSAHLHGIDNTLGTLLFPWTEITATSENAIVNHAYVANNGGAGVTFNLPASFNIGDRIRVQGKGAGGFKLQANTGQTIHVGSAATTVAGSVTTTDQWDAIEITGVTANTTWSTSPPMGNFTVA